jgi:hypothetical protein
LQQQQLERRRIEPDRRLEARLDDRDLISRRVLRFISSGSTRALLDAAVFPLV